MNKHFHDSLYYLKRAGEHTKRGIRSEVEPIVTRGRRLVGHDPEPEPELESESRRLETVREELHGLERRAERRGRTVTERVRRTVSR